MKGEEANSVRRFHKQTNIFGMVKSMRDINDENVIITDATVSRLDTQAGGGEAIALL